MTKLSDLRGRVRTIGNELQNAIRSEPGDASLAGWGQFVETSSRVFQIGPYGTSAAVLVTEIGSSDGVIERRVKDRLLAFWNERPNGKLYPQNVRLAFMVLALARTNDADLMDLRDGIIAELRRRQHDDGSWSDAAPYPGSAGGGHVDATSWIVLALLRSGRTDTYTGKAAQWLANRAQDAGSIQLLSSIGLAAAILGHPEPETLTDLRKRAFDVLEQTSITQEESISFFDYDETDGDEHTPKRDYLCFPAFYPLTIIINGLLRNAGFIESVRLDSYLTSAIENLNMICSGRTYKLPTARYASTVDQAIFALSYEQLAAADEKIKSVAASLAPLYKRARRSLLLRLFVPLVILALALVTVNDPTTAPLVLKSIIGSRADKIVAFCNDHKAGIQLSTAVLLAVMPALPRSGLKLLHERFVQRW